MMFCEHGLKCLLKYTVGASPQSWCFVLFSFGGSSYQLGCSKAAVLAQRLVEHIKNVLQNIMTKWTPYSVCPRWKLTCSNIPRYHCVAAPVADVGGPARAHRVRVVLGQPGRQFNGKTFSMCFSLKNHLSFGLKFPTYTKKKFKNW